MQEDWAEEQGAKEEPTQGKEADSQPVAACHGHGRAWQGDGAPNSR